MISVVLLAAGQGTRMELLEGEPCKQLVRLPSNNSIIGRLFQQLAKQPEVGQIVVVLGCQALSIEQELTGLLDAMHTLDVSQSKVSFVLNEDYASDTNAISCLVGLDRLKQLGWPGDRTLIVEADVLLGDASVDQIVTDSLFGDAPLIAFTNGNRSEQKIKLRLKNGSSEAVAMGGSLLLPAPGYHDKTMAGVWALCPAWTSWLQKELERLWQSQISPYYFHPIETMLARQEGKLDTASLPDAFTANSREQLRWAIEGLSED